MKRLAAILRRWAERLDPLAPPTVVSYADFLEGVRVGREMTREDELREMGAKRPTTLTRKLHGISGGRR